MKSTTESKTDALVKTDATEVIDVPLEASPDPMPTDDQAIEAMRRAGFVALPKDIIRDLSTVGIYVKGIGVLKIQRGRVMVNQQKIDHAMNNLLTHMDALIADKSKKSKTAELSKVARDIGYLGGKITESQKLAVELESATVASGAPVTDTPNNQQSFAPKAKIQPLNTVIHNHGPTQVVLDPQK